MTMPSLRKCRDCERRAVPNSPFCADCVDRIARAAFARPEPEWVQRAREKTLRPMDFTGLSR